MNTSTLRIISRLLAGMFLGLMEEHRDRAPNFLELSFQTSKGLILVTVTQPQGATPANLLGQAKQQIRLLEAELQALNCWDQIRARILPHLRPPKLNGRLQPQSPAPPPIAPGQLSLFDPSHQ